VAESIAQVEFHEIGLAEMSFQSNTGRKLFAAKEKIPDAQALEELVGLVVFIISVQVNTEVHRNIDPVCKEPFPASIGTVTEMFGKG
jgi:hypothetical protein